jgi:hypothetical protein
MNFNTVTKSGVFLFTPKDPSSTVDITSTEQLIIDRFNKKMIRTGIYLEKFSDNLKLSFTIVARSVYNTGSGEKNSHPTYGDIIVSTGHLYSIADSLNLKCTRSGE